MKTRKFQVNLGWPAPRLAQNAIHPITCFQTLAAILFLTVCILAVPSRTNANLIMGNLPISGGGYGISTEAGNTFGTAVEFTPLNNVAFNSVTLWISGYTGLDGSSLYLSLMNDSSSYGFPFKEPAATIIAGSTVANDGSDAAFTFGLGGQLKANTPYWLFLYLQVPNGGFGPDYGKFNCHWDSGGTSDGAVNIDGSEAFVDGFVPSSFQSGAPAFAINSIPDHTSTALLLVSAVGCCVLFARRYRSQN